MITSYLRKSLLKNWLQPLATAVIVLYGTTITTTVLAEPAGDDFSRFVSGTGSILYGTAGVVLPLLTDGPLGKEHALRVTDSLATSLLVCEGLKKVIRERRPDSSSNDSFPSCHATAAFAIALAESKYHPKYAILWYAGAGLIAYSRVDLRRHNVGDAIAGAVLGTGTSLIELKLPHGILLYPLIGNDDRGGRFVGLQLKQSF